MKKNDGRCVCVCWGGGGGAGEALFFLEKPAFKIN